MKRIAADLYQSEPEHPFGDSVKTCAYLLRRPDGNVLLYSSIRLRQNEAQIHDLGGIAHQYLNHRDEASDACEWVWRTFNAPLACHQAEEAAVARHCTVMRTFDRVTDLHPDLRAIPTPGHCPGSTCYLWQARDRSCLFTGDTLYLSNGEWRVYVNHGTNAEMIDSLQRIANLDFDILIPGLYIGTEAYAAIEPPQFRRDIDAVIERLNRGERH